MKRVLLFLILISSICCVNSQKYIPFPTDNAQWNISYYSHCDDCYETNITTLLKYSISGDTIIKNIHYKKLWRNIGTDAQPIYKGVGGLREQNKKIYYYGRTYNDNCAESSSEYLLYDFNKVTGDTVFINSPYFYYTITGLDSIKIGNEFRKRYKIHKYWVSDEYIVEGIGNISSGLLGDITRVLAYPECWNVKELVCFSQNGESIYKDPNYVYCDSLLKKSDKTDTIIKPNRINLCVLKIDYLTYHFESGDMAYYRQTVQTDSLPFKIDYWEPGDIGGITFKIKTTNDTIFDASIIWNGTGRIIYPKSFTDFLFFNSLIDIRVPKPTQIEYFYFGIDGRKMEIDNLFVQKTDSVWNAVKSLNITRQFANVDYKVGIYLYTPAVGVFQPSKAKWIVFLYYNDISSSLNNPHPDLPFNIYPNPCGGILTVTASEPFSYRIINMNGQVVKYGVISNNQIDINDLVDGVYSLAYINDKKMFNRKIIKISNQ